MHHLNLQAADRMGKGKVELQELLHSPEWKSLYPPEKLEVMFDAMDSNKNGVVSLLEVLKVVFPGANNVQIQVRFHTSKETGSANYIFLNFRSR